MATHMRTLKLLGRADREIVPGEGLVARVDLPVRRQARHHHRRQHEGQQAQWLHAQCTGASGIRAPLYGEPPFGRAA